MDATQAILFRQKRDRLRLIVDYRKGHLDSRVRGGDEEANQAKANYEQAKAHSDKDYEEPVVTERRTVRRRGVYPRGEFLLLENTPENG